MFKKRLTETELVAYVVATAMESYGRVWSDFKENHLGEVVPDEVGQKETISANVGSALAWMRKSFSEQQFIRSVRLVNGYLAKEANNNSVLAGADELIPMYMGIALKQSPDDFDSLLLKRILTPGGYEKLSDNMLLRTMIFAEVNSLYSSAVGTLIGLTEEFKIIEA